MTNEARKISGYILLSVATIIHSGYFLATDLRGQQEHLQLTDFQKSIFRAGHAHAGVFVIINFLVQFFVDQATLFNG